MQLACSGNILYLLLPKRPDPLSLAPFRAGRDARMSRSEVLSPEGLRLDGRRPGEIRRLRCQLSAEPKADGSAYLEQGNTKVLVTVTGPHEVSSQRKAQHDRAVLHCTYAALPFSAGQHKNPSRTADSELASSVRSVFDPVVQTQLYPRTQIDVSITLLQADGGVRAACINATTLALIDAGIAMEDFVCACTAGAVQSALLLDMNAQEDNPNPNPTPSPNPIPDPDPNPNPNPNPNPSAQRMYVGLP